MLAFIQIWLRSDYKERHKVIIHRNLIKNETEMNVLERI